MNDRAVFANDHTGQTLNPHPSSTPPVACIAAACSAAFLVRPRPRATPEPSDDDLNGKQFLVIGTCGFDQLVIGRLLATRLQTLLKCRLEIRYLVCGVLNVFDLKGGRI